MKVYYIGQYVKGTMGVLHTTGICYMYAFNWIKCWIVR